MPLLTFTATGLEMPRKYSTCAPSSCAVRMPIQVICDLLGVPDTEYPRFVRWGASVALALDSTWTFGQYRLLRDSLTEMSEFFTELLAHRRVHPLARVADPVPVIASRRCSRVCPMPPSPPTCSMWRSPTPT